jgi:hypothetical protein
MQPGAIKQAVPLTKENFLELMNVRAAPMIHLCRRALKRPTQEFLTSRPLIRKLYSEATRVEELLYVCGAKNNKHWCHLCTLSAAVKAFSNALSVNLYINEAIPRYQLLPVEGDFFSDTLRSASSLGTVLLRVARNFLSEAYRVGIEIGGKLEPITLMEDVRFIGALPADRILRHVSSPAEVILRFTTAFLSESGQSHLRNFISKPDRSEYATCIPDLYGEKNLGIAEREFRNLQSMYHTYISDTDVERQDRNLPVIRGHISIIQHLLELAVVLAHYYERHIMGYGNARNEALVMEPDKLLVVLVEYSITYAGLFMLSAQHLCRNIIKRYTEPSSIEVTVPVYRGFHVRPSTLIAKIVLHYGNEVYLVTDDGSRYDASSPLELFRVNEKINAQKRRILAQYLSTLHEVQKPPTTVNEMQEALRRVFLDLLHREEIVLYSGVLPFEELTPDQEEDFSEFVKRALAYFLAQGLIDIRIEMRVKFVGDKYVLDDIAVLAESGYAEDNFGNDIMLPKKLAYLKR